MRLGVLKIYRQLPNDILSLVHLLVRKIEIGKQIFNIYVLKKEVLRGTGNILNIRVRNRNVEKITRGNYCVKGNLGTAL